MKVRSFLLIAAALFLLNFTSNASVTNVTYADDHDGAIVCPPVYTWPGGTVNIYGDEFLGGPAHVVGDIYTDTTVDPTLTLASAIGNDTTFSWTSYQVNVIMSVNFSFVTPGPTVTSPLGDWTVTSVVAPTLQLSGIYAGQYLGTLIFSDGTPIPPNLPDPASELDFSYSIHFAGSTHYTFTQEMIPVPEPSTLGLMMVGGLLLGGFSAAKRRQ